jgi:hypothetical protein
VGAVAKKTARFLWVVMYSMVLVLLGVALIGVGVVFAGVGIQAMFELDDAAHTIAGVLFAVVGVAAFIGGVVLLFRLRRATSGASGRRSGGHTSYAGGWIGGDAGGGWGGGDGGGGGC